MDSQFITQYTEDVLCEAGLENLLPNDFKQDYVRQLSYELRRRIGIMAVRSLDSKSFSDFRELVRDNPTRDLLCVVDFFRERLVDFNEIVAEAFFDFRCQIMEQASQLKTLAIERPTELVSSNLSEKESFFDLSSPSPFCEKANGE